MSFWITFAEILAGLAWFTVVCWLGGLWYEPWRMAEKEFKDYEWWRWVSLALSILLLAAGMALLSRVK